ncbi:hypothetical protein [Deinococcus apachensis]|uniref:hypothetical protein n=1 Tax=Deinococcus apachensis TaxID=309886 RepID=UPI00036D7222|nr:hypothetical protein [Deinococcus apachensis]
MVAGSERVLRGQITVLRRPQSEQFQENPHRIVVEACAYFVGTTVQSVSVEIYIIEVAVREIINGGGFYLKRHIRFYLMHLHNKLQ